MLPDRSLLIDQKLMENAKIAHNYDILSGQKFIKNAKNVNLANFWKPEACGQIVLPDRSLLIGQKLVGNAKIEKLKWDTLGDFRTLWLLGDGLLFFSKMHDHPFLMHSDWQAVTFRRAGEHPDAFACLPKALFLHFW